MASFISLDSTVSRNCCKLSLYGVWVFKICRQIVAFEGSTAVDLLLLPLLRIKKAVRYHRVPLLSYDRIGLENVKKKNSAIRS